MTPNADRSWWAAYLRNERRAASLVETCKLNGVNPQLYFTDLLTRLVNGWPQNRIDELALAVPMKRFDRPMLGFLTRQEMQAILDAPDTATWAG
jgi:hypothetical protein